MDTVQERKQMTVAIFETHLERFIDDSKYSNNLDVRWLSSHLEETLRAVRQVRCSNLDPEYKKLVFSFRASEIEKELSSKRKDVDVLERDLATIQRSLA